MAVLRTRLFLKFRDGRLEASDMEIECPTQLSAEQVAALGVEGEFWQTIFRFPGVVDRKEFFVRSRSSLKCVVGAISSLRQFSREFHKGGGKIYGAMHNDEHSADLSEPIDLKYFFDLP